MVFHTGRGGNGFLRRAAGEINPKADTGLFFVESEAAAQGINSDKTLGPLGVFLHDQNEEQVKKIGIIISKFSIPSRYVVTTKEEDSIISELKVGIIKQGRKCAMQKRTHYDESFTPTQTQGTLRILL